MSTVIASQPQTQRRVELYDTHRCDRNGRTQTVSLPDGLVTPRTVIVAAGYGQPVTGSTLALDGVVIPPEDFDTPLDPIPQQATYIKPVVGG